MQPLKKKKNLMIFTLCVCVSVCERESGGLKVCLLIQLRYVCGNVPTFISDIPCIVCIACWLKCINVSAGEIMAHILTKEGPL